jgi:uncharacterized membrane protein HdeD (DUF308 family)
MSDRTSRIIGSALLLVFGLVLLLYPGATLLFAGRLIGFVLLVAGVVMFVSQIGNLKNGTAPAGQIALAVAMLVLGVVVMSNAAAFTVLIQIVLGVVMIVDGITHITNSRFLLGPQQTALVVMGVISIIFGVIVVFNPFDTAKIFVSVSGVFYIYDGIVGLIEAALGRAV